MKIRYHRCRKLRKAQDNFLVDHSVAVVREITLSKNPWRLTGSIRGGISIVISFCPFCGKNLPVPRSLQ